MITINIVEDRISGAVNGQPFSVSYDAKKYDEMLELQAKSEDDLTLEELEQVVKDFQALTTESYKEFIETMSPYVMVNKSNNKMYLQYNGVISSKALPKALGDKIIKSVEKGQPIEPLVKFWARFLRNINYSDRLAQLLADYISAPFTNDVQIDQLMREQGLSKEVATQAATTPQVSITREGLMVCYKVSTELFDKKMLNEDEEVVTRSRYGKEIDENTGLVTYKAAENDADRVFFPTQMGLDGGDPFRCGETLGHIIKLGQVIKLDSWDQVDCNLNHSCVKGLHVGGLRYIKGYQGWKDTVTHNVFIDPMHIGAIVGLGEGSDGAMRVKQYVPHSVFGKVGKTLYHSSRYAQLTDEEYAKMVEEAVELTRDEDEKRQSKAAERAALARI